MKVKIDPEKPIHIQLELCLNKRDSDGRYCSKPAGHRTSDHYWNLTFHGNKVGVEEPSHRAGSGLVSHREIRNIASSVSNVIHLIVSDVGTLACGDPIGIGNGSFRKVTIDPEVMTCRRCEIGWLTYQRDQYKDMFERNETVLGAKLAEIRTLRDANIALQHQNDELRRNAQGGH